MKYFRNFTLVDQKFGLSTVSSPSPRFGMEGEGISSFRIDPSLDGEKKNPKASPSAIFRQPETPPIRFASNRKEVAQGLRVVEIDTQEVTHLISDHTPTVDAELFTGENTWDEDPCDEWDMWRAQVEEEMLKLKSTNFELQNQILEAKERADQIAADAKRQGKAILKLKEGYRQLIEQGETDMLGSAERAAIQAVQNEATACAAQLRGGAEAMAQKVIKDQLHSAFDEVVDRWKESEMVDDLQLEILYKVAAEIKLTEGWIGRAFTERLQMEYQKVSNGFWGAIKEDLFKMKERLREIEDAKGGGSVDNQTQTQSPTSSIHNGQGFNAKGNGGGGAEGQISRQGFFPANPGYGISRRNKRFQNGKGSQFQNNVHHGT